MGKKGKGSKKDKNQNKEKYSLSEILPAEAIELLNNLKKSLREKENNDNYTKQGIKRLDDVKKKRKRRFIRKDK